MPDETEQTDAGVPSEEQAPPPIPDPVEAVRSGWRGYWQVPTLLAGAGVLLLGVAFSMATSPEPDFDPVLTRAERMIERESYQDAIGLLNAEVHPYTGEGGELGPVERQRYHLAKARAIYFGQRRLGISDDRNHVSVVREYLEAERQGLVLSPRDVAALADTFLSRNDLGAALGRINSLGAGHQAVKEPVVRRAVGLLLRPPAPDQAAALALLADVLADPETTPGQRVWAVEAQCGVRLDQGYVDETITRLLREIPRLTGAGKDGRARLHLLLARAYRTLNADREAMGELERAAELSGAGDPHYPMVLLERARLEHRAGDAARARDTYAEIAARHADSDAFAWALIGLGETEAGVGDLDRSLEAYATLVDGYDAMGLVAEPTRDRVVRSLLERAGERLTVNDPRGALRYTALGERLMRGRDLPTELIDAVGVAHERVAEELVAGVTSEPDPLLGLDPSTRVEVQRHLVAAAINRRLHAERFVLTDVDRYASSLWRAADLFDRAGDQREAVHAYKTFAEALPGDPRHAEARFRMAEALRAMGEFQPAAEAYRDLIAAQESTAGADVGAWADASFVPLAQAYLYDEDPSNDAEAERLLTRAVDGTMGGTGTRMFRDALAELAFLYDRTGRSARAIERLDELIERYPADPQRGLFEYRLGEANRRLAGEIGRSLLESLPPTTRAERSAELDRRRTEAIDRYTAAIGLLGAKREADRTRLEDLSLRNAHFYVGDLLSDLGRFEEAIRAYDLARDRYDSEPATLVALIQIVNAHMAQGDLRRARTANERARRFFLSLPDETWDDPTLPMDRADWQAWLDASSRLLAAGG